MAKNDDRMPNAVVEDVQLLYPNFAGVPDDFTREGDRNFTIILDERTAKKMAQDGWNVKEKDVSRDEDSTDIRYTLKVKVNYNGRPPQVYMVGASGKPQLIGEDLVGLLDDAEVTNVDVILSPYSWEVRGDVGITAYLKSGYFTIEEDPLMRKYNLLGGIHDATE